MTLRADRLDLKCIQRSEYGDYIWHIFPFRFESLLQTGVDTTRADLKIVGHIFRGMSKLRYILKSLRLQEKIKKSE